MITFAIFFLMPRLAGATPESMAVRYVGKSADPATIKSTVEKLGFNKPIHVQYWDWVSGVMFGKTIDTGASKVECPAPCLGYSYRTYAPIMPEVKQRFPVTLSLAVGAAVLWLSFGVTVGVISALKRGSLFDRAAMAVALAGVSLPIFWTGLVSLAIFSYQLGWTAPGGSYTPITENPGKWAFDLLLPWITLALLFSAQYARLTRAGMLETMSEDYIRTARAKGLTAGQAILHHALRNAMVPVLTIMGMQFSFLLAGAIIIENVFYLPGLGRLIFQAITQRDLIVVESVVMILVFAVIVVTFLVDLAYAAIDPRLRKRA